MKLLTHFYNNIRFFFDLNNYFIYTFQNFRDVNWTTSRYKSHPNSLPDRHSDKKITNWAKRERVALSWIAFIADEWLYLNKEAREPMRRGANSSPRFGPLLMGPGLVSDFRRGTRLPRGKKIRQWYINLLTSLFIRLKEALYTGAKGAPGYPTVQTLAITQSTDRPFPVGSFLR